MTVEDWIAKTASVTQAFSLTPAGEALRDEAAAKSPSWKHLSEYGKRVWLCCCFNPLK